MNQAPPARRAILQGQLQLPAGLGSLIGREDDLVSAARLLQEPAVRLLTFTGAGGVGKTRLAVEVATECGAEFHDGGRFVPLNRLTDPEEVVPAIGRSLGFVESGGPDLSERLLDELRDQHFLLFLDNFEHVLPAAPVVARLLAGCTDLKVLVTSQAALHLAGEYEFPVRPLAVPPSAAEDFDTLAASPAVRLFVERARAVAPHFHLDVSNAQATAELCLMRDRFLDGESLAELADRHAMLQLALVDSASSGLRRRSSERWLNRMESERESLAEAVAWFVQSGRQEEAVRMAAWLWRFWFLHGYVDECRRWLGEVLSMAPVPDTPEAAEALQGAGFAAHYQADYRAAESFFISSWSIAQRLHDTLHTAVALNGLGGLARVRGAYSEAKQLYERALALCAGVDDKHGVATHLERLGLVQWLMGETDAAQESLSRALALSREVDDRRGVVQCLQGLGWFALNRGDTGTAAASLADALQRSRSLGDRWNTARALYSLGLVSNTEKELGQAWQRQAEALRAANQVGDKALMRACLEALAAVADAERRHSPAAELLGAAAALASAAPEVRSAVLESPVLDRQYAGLVGSVSKALSEARFGAAWERGHGSTPLQALDRASRLEESAPGSHPEGLSDREIVVLRLVATGGTNAQIAKQLFLSIRTVDAHLRTIYRKLGVTSRAAATRFAIEHGLA